jgi:hypothetical protein
MASKQAIAYRDDLIQRMLQRAADAVALGDSDDARSKAATAALARALPADDTPEVSISDQIDALQRGTARSIANLLPEADAILQGLARTYGEHMDGLAPALRDLERAQPAAARGGLLRELLVRAWLVRGLLG